jgi:hypothetical protein
MYRNDLIKQAMGDKKDYEVAYCSGVSPDTVKRARGGENLSIKSLSAIAKALNLKMPELFTFEHANNGPSEGDQASSLSVTN